MPAITRNKAKILASAIQPQPIMGATSTSVPNEPSLDIQPAQDPEAVLSPDHSSIAEDEAVERMLQHPQMHTSNTPEITFVPSSVSPTPMDCSPVCDLAVPGGGSVSSDAIDLQMQAEDDESILGSGEDGAVSPHRLTPSSTQRRLYRTRTSTESFEVPLYVHAENPSAQVDMKALAVSAMNTAQMQLENAATLSTAVLATESLYYAAIKLAVLRAQAGDVASEITIRLPQILLDACCGQFDARTESPCPTGPDIVYPDQSSTLPGDQMAIIVCHFIWKDHEPEESTVKFLLPNTKGPTVLSVLDGITSEARTDENLHRKWRYLLREPAAFQIYTSPHLLEPGKSPNLVGMTLLGPLDAIMSGALDIIATPATGLATVALTEALLCGSYLDLEYSDDEEEPVWLSNAEVFSFLFKENEVRDSTPQLNESTMPSQQEQENSVHVNCYLDATYGEISQELTILRIHRRAPRPYFTRRLLELTDSIAHSEGLKLGNLFSDSISQRQVHRGTAHLNYPLILQWASGQITLNYESWRQKRSKLSFDAAHDAWVIALENIQDVVRNSLQLEPNIRLRLNNLSPIAYAIGVLQALKDSKHLEIPASQDNCTREEYSAMDMKWKTFDKLRSHLKSLVSISETADSLRRSIQAAGGSHMPANMPRMIEEIIGLVDLCQNLL